MKRKRIDYLVTVVIIALVVIYCGLSEKQSKSASYKSQALQVLAEEVIQDIVLEQGEAKLMEYLDGSAIKLWVIEEEIDSPVVEPLVDEEAFELMVFWM